MPGKLTIQQTRGLVLVLLVLTALITAGAYFGRLRYRTKHQTTLPARVPPNIRQSQNFSYSKTEQGRTIFTINAASVREQQANGRSVLEDVEIITYGAQGNRHDRIYTKECEYDAKTGQMHSQGQVEIELASLPGQPLDPAMPHNSPMAPSDSATPSIFVKTSGVNFDGKSGIVTTEQPLDFRFDRGSGRAVGAVYDSRQRTLQLKSAVELEARGVSAGQFSPTGAPALSSKPPKENGQDPPVFIKASELLYQQAGGRVHGENIRIERSLPEAYRQLTAEHGDLGLDSQNRVQSADFSGNPRVYEKLAKTRTQAPRETHLSGNELSLRFKEQVLDQAFAVGNVQLDVTTATDRTESSAQRLELQFAGQNRELSQALWKGGLRMVATPLGAQGDVRTLISDSLQMLMKPGGREMDAARTYSPGRIELAPVGGARAASAAAPQLERAGAAARAPARVSADKRILTADDFWMKFQDQNQIELLVANKNVRVESYPPAAPATNRASPPSKAPAPRVTTSDGLVAHFGKESHQVESLEQKGNFHYQDGERQASADRAVYTAPDEKIQLNGLPGRNPEVWDSSTRTSARQILLDDKNSTGVAEQEVRTIYLPSDDKAPVRSQKGQNQVPGPLSSKDPVYVIAQRMVSNSKSGLTRYESAADGARVRLWQNHDVIEARTLLLDRANRRMTAEGQVTTVLVESSTSTPARVASLANTGARAAAPAKGESRTEVRAGGAARAPAPTTDTSSRTADARPISISAESMVYTDNDRRAHYERKVVLHRQESLMRSASLDAYLRSPDEVKPGESRLERGIARGGVEIDDVAPAGPRHAAAEMAEYTTGEEKIVLSGGQPYVFDEQKGYTRGRQLTYYVRDDSIFVHGDASSRTFTEQRVKKRR